MIREPIHGQRGPSTLQQTPNGCRPPQGSTDALVLSRANKNASIRPLRGAWPTVDNMSSLRIEETIKGVPNPKRLRRATKKSSGVSTNCSRVMPDRSWREESVDLASSCLDVATPSLTHPTMRVLSSMSSATLVDVQTWRSSRPLSLRKSSSYCVRRRARKGHEFLAYFGSPTPKHQLRQAWAHRVAFINRV